MSIVVNKKKNIAIIGAGAAGLVAAFYALEGGNSVTVFEKNDIAGKKLRITGNGRCNFTNEDINVSHYAHGSDTGFIDSVLKKNGKDELIAFLDLCGIPSFQKNGYYYPLSERAGEVTDLLVNVLTRKGAKIRFGEDFHEILRNTDATFNLNGEKYDVLILACGGKAAPATGSDGSGFKLARSFGHTVSFTYPVLVPLKVDQKILKEISGVRIKAKAYGIVDGEIVSSDRGEIQFTDTAISGIPVFQISRHLTKAIEEKKDVRIRLDALPDVASEQVEEFVSKRTENYRKNSLNNMAVTGSLKELFEGIFPKKYYEFLLNQFILMQRSKPQMNNQSYSLEDYNKTEQVNTAKKESVSESGIEFVRFIKNFEFIITGHAGYENAQCTRGGVLLSEMKDTLESEKTPNLYIIGEMLDVDGDCGGYNLQWAFSSGKLVGENV